MRIIICSDSHGNARNLQKVIENNMKSDIFIHLGDGEREFEIMREKYPHVDMRYVRGNNDYKSSAPLFLIVDTPGARIFCTHGHRYNVNYGLDRLVYAAREQDCNVVCFGHTHCRLLDYDDGLHIINPGSLSRPRDGLPCSYGWVDVVGGGIVGNVTDAKNF